MKYQGSIRAYITDFGALNTFAKATGKGLYENIDLAMPDSILDMRFNQNPEDPLDDEQYLHATYRARLQVEKKKALKQAKEAMRAGTTPGGASSSRDKKKNSPNKGSSDNT